MIRVEATKARNDFAATINLVAYGGDRVVLQRRGKALVAIVPMADVELLEKLEDHLDLEDARRALANPRNRKRIPWKKVRAQLGL